MKNTAQAHSNSTDSNQDDETVTAVQSPVLSQTKSGVLDMMVVAPSNRADVGDKINYTITATNSGNVTLNNVTVVDPLLGTLTCTPVQPATLAPGASITCLGSYTLTQGDINAGNVHNVSTADSNETPPTETPNDVPVPKAPAISLVKSATPATYATLGQTISYSYLVTNTGNVTLAGPVTVTDDKATVTCPAVPGGGLVPGGSITCSASYTITQPDLDGGSVKNTAQAHSNSTDSNQDDETVTAVQSPVLSQTKSGVLDMMVVAPSNRADVGDKINYTITATNSGNVTLNNVTVVDPLLGTLTCTPVQPATLAPGASITCLGSYTLTQGDINAGNVHNVSTADSNETPPTETPNDVPVPKAPAISLVKSATPATYATLGQTISYSYLVTNTGNVTLAGPVTVTDDKATVTCPAVPGGGLVPGGSITCSASYTITQPDLDGGSVKNTAQAHSNSTDSNQDDETVTAVQSPVLSQTKSGVLDMTVVAPSNRADVGDKINYTITATNSGNVTLNNVTVVDPLLGTLTCTPVQPATLAPGASITCLGSYTLTQGDINAGNVHNVSTADSNETPPTETPNDVPVPKAPAISLVKSATPATYATLGQTISYSYLVTNTGNVTLAGPVTVTDDKATVTCPAVPGGGLVPGGSITCSASYTITQPDLDGGSVKNTAQAHSNSTDSNQDDETVTAVQSPVLSQTKSGVLDMTVVAPSNRADVGDKINYTITATNSGNVTLNNVTVVDPLLGTLTCTPVQPATLAPGASITCLGSYTLTQGDINAGNVHNVSTADSNETPPTETPNDVPVPKAPAISLVKSATPATYATLGQTISYSYLVTNTGNVTLAGPVTVTDDKATVTCPAVPGGGLVPGGSITCSASYTITQPDLDGGSVKNTAQAHSNSTDSNQDDETVTAVQSPVLSQTKSGVLDMTVVAPSNRADVGDKINYTITATNSGNVTLNNVTVVDPLLGTLTCTPVQPATLAPGASITCLGSYTLTQGDINAGNVHNVSTADSNETPPTETPNDVPVPKAPAISLVKSATPATYATLGQTISYSYLVTNTGNVTLAGPVTVTDDKATVTCPAVPGGGLVPGGSITCSASYTITQPDLDGGSVKNTAQAHSNSTDSNQDDETVTAVQSPVLSQTKSGVLDMTVVAPSNRADVGDKINYTITATNSGNVTLNNVTVVDPLLGTLTCTPVQPATLAPGASITCLGSYTLTQGDINAGNVHNVSTADSNETPPTETPNDVPVPKAPAVLLDKTAVPGKLPRFWCRNHVQLPLDQRRKRDPDRPLWRDGRQDDSDLSERGGRLVDSESRRIDNLYGNVRHDSGGRGGRLCDEHCLRNGRHHRRGHSDVQHGQRDGDVCPADPCDRFGSVHLRPGRGERTAVAADLQSGSAELAGVQNHGNQPWPVLLQPEPQWHVRHGG